MQSYDWGQFFASTLGVLLLLCAVLWWVKRNRAMVNGVVSDRRIQVKEALPLSLKHKIVLIQVDNQMVLTSVSPGEVKTLHTWTEGTSHVA